MAGIRLGASVLLLVAAALTGPVVAQERRVSAILMVEDEDWPGAEATEELGVALYGRFLEEGPYREVRILKGRVDPTARLAAAVRELAARNDALDLFLSVHTTTRAPEEMLGRIPAEARKLRLVYSTACYGNDEERAAWEALGARTVVTHVGINNPLIALPYVLSRWMAGDPIGPVVAAGYHESGLVTRYALSLPGMPTLQQLSAFGGDFLAGSRPVISGDPGLRIGDGLPGFRSRLPEALRYDRARGGPLGLVLRALAGRFSFDGQRIRELLSRLMLDPDALPIPAHEFDKVERLSVEWSDRDDDARLVLRLRKRIKVELEEKTYLRIGEKVTLRAGAIDAEGRRVVLHTTGLSIQRGLLRVAINRLRFTPDGDGYKVKATAGLWGVIPVWKTIHIGGRRPEPSPTLGPILRDSAGIVGELTRHQ